MATITKDGFDFFTFPNGGEYLSLKSSYFFEALTYAKKMGIKRINLSFVSPLEIENLNFFENHDFFEEVYIFFQKKVDLSGIYYLSNLKNIIIADEINNKIDLSKFDYLENIWAFWSDSLNIEKCTNLKKLVLHKIGEPDLRSLSGLNKLEVLELVNSRKLLALTGIESIRELREFSLFILPQLHDFNPLTANKNIQHLQIEVCKKMRKLDFVSDMKKLESLKINECKEIDSLKVLNDLKKLQEIWIRNTKILDGDLTPLNGRRQVYCTNIKGHSHTWQELKKLQKP